MLQDMKSHPVFLALSLVMAFWNFSLNIAEPFFNVLPDPGYAFAGWRRGSRCLGGNTMGIPGDFCLLGDKPVFCYPFVCPLTSCQR
jgi:hypothetical protein